MIAQDENVNFSFVSRNITKVVFVSIDTILLPSIEVFLLVEPKMTLHEAALIFGIR